MKFKKVVFSGTDLLVLNLLSFFDSLIDLSERGQLSNRSDSPSATILCLDCLESRSRKVLHLEQQKGSFSQICLRE